MRSEGLAFLRRTAHTQPPATPFSLCRPQCSNGAWKGLLHPNFTTCIAFASRLLLILFTHLHFSSRHYLQEPQAVLEPDRSQDPESSKIRSHHPAETNTDPPSFAYNSPATLQGTLPPLHVPPTVQRLLIAESYIRAKTVAA
jgi:hypothetical protein